MANQIELLKELQVSELTRFQSVAEIYEFKTRNPVGLRRLNLHNAFNVIAASKFVGWPSTVSVDEFLKAACLAVTDSLQGPYIDDLPNERRAELRHPETSEDWFDFALRGLFIAFAAKDSASLSVVSNWVTLNMRYDCGADDVPPSTNVLYEYVCYFLRAGAIPPEFEIRFQSGLKRKRDRFLAEMLFAIESRERRKFVSALSDYTKSWKGQKKFAILDEIISLDASLLCNLWLHLGGDVLEEFREENCIFLSNQNHERHETRADPRPRDADAANGEGAN
jgi:hypothetical protein